MAAFVWNLFYIWVRLNPGACYDWERLDPDLVTTRTLFGNDLAGFSLGGRVQSEIHLCFRACSVASVRFVNGMVMGFIVTGFVLDLG